MRETNKMKKPILLKKYLWENKNKSSFINSCVPNNKFNYLVYKSEVYLSDESKSIFLSRG